MFLAYQATVKSCSKLDLYRWVIVGGFLADKVDASLTFFYLNAVGF